MRSRTFPNVSSFSMVRTVDELITYFDKSTVLSDEITSLLCRFSLSVTVSVLSVVSFLLRLEQFLCTFVDNLPTV